MNPYDRALFHLRKEEGFVLGGEGSGIVVKVGDEKYNGLLNKKVSFLGGAYAEYAIYKAHFLIVLDDSTDVKQGANAFINPVTVIA